MRLPVVDIGVQGFNHGLRIAPGLGGQHFNALGQQHSGFALNLNPVLQVFNHLNPVAELAAQRGERLFAQGRASFGGITLPSHRIGNVELAHGQQSLGLVGPLLGDGFLALAALNLIKLFAQQLGRAFVFATHFLEHGLQVVGSGLSDQPFANFRGALGGGMGRKCPARQRVQRMGFVSFGGGFNHFGGFGSFIEDREHESRIHWGRIPTVKRTGLNPLFSPKFLIRQKVSGTNY